MIQTLTPDDAKLMLAAQTHLGTTQINHQMRTYAYDRSKDGAHIIRLDKTWDKLVLAARAICAIENPSDVAVVGTRLIATRSVLKFAKYTGAFPFAGRFTPGTFTNQIQKAFREPRLLVISCTMADRQAINEARYVNIPVIGLCDMNSDMRYVDIGIPCNTRSPHSVGLVWWLLCREVLRIRGSISRDVPWDVMVDLFIYREPEEQAEEEQQAVQAALPTSVGGAAGYMEEGAAAGAEGLMTGGADMAGAIDDWGAPISQDWGSSMGAAGAPAGGFGAVGEPTAPVVPVAGAVPVAPAQGADEWSNMQDDWGASMN